jgi:hypothetical protein
LTGIPRSAPPRFPTGRFCLHVLSMTRTTVSLLHECPHQDRSQQRTPTGYPRSARCLGRPLPTPTAAPADQSRVCIHRRSKLPVFLSVLKPFHSDNDSFQIGQQLAHLGAPAAQALLAAVKILVKAIQHPDPTLLSGLLKALPSSRGTTRDDPLEILSKYDDPSVIPFVLLGRPRVISGNIDVNTILG